MPAFLTRIRTWIDWRINRDFYPVQHVPHEFTDAPGMWDPRTAVRIDELLDTNEGYVGNRLPAKPRAAGVFGRKVIAPVHSIGVDRG